MIIALDYDGTITADPVLFLEFAERAMARGHEVICVTMRHAHEPIGGSPIEVVYTGRQGKKAFMLAAGRAVDVWIDDTPEWILNEGR
jgi:hypothetical protein